MIPGIDVVVSHLGSKVWLCSYTWEARDIRCGCRCSVVTPGKEAISGVGVGVGLSNLENR